MKNGILIVLILGAGITAGALWFSMASEPVATPTPVVIQTPTEIIVEATAEPHQNEAFILPAVQPAYVPSREADVEDPTPDANAAGVIHLETERVLFAKNESVRAPIASLTKILTALIVHEHPLLVMSDVVTVTSKSVFVDEIKQTLYEGEEMLVSDLVQLMLVESSNDAAYALAEYAELRGVDLVAEMNAEALALNMVDSQFTDPAGLDDEAYSTVNDLIRLVLAAVEIPDLWDVMRSPSLTVTSVDGAFVHVASNTNKLLESLDGVVWGKTGNTDGALGCMLLVVKMPQESDTLVSIVLGSQARFADTELLVGWAQEAYALP